MLDGVPLRWTADVRKGMQLMETCWRPNTQQRRRTIMVVEDDALCGKCIQRGGDHLLETRLRSFAVKAYVSPALAFLEMEKREERRREEMRESRDGARILIPRKSSTSNHSHSHPRQ